MDSSPSRALVLVTFLDLLGGLLAWRSSGASWKDETVLKNMPYLLLGVLVGAIFLKFGPPTVGRYLFLVSLIAVGLLFLYNLGSSRESKLNPNIRKSFVAGAGFSGVSSGLDGPPLALALDGESSPEKIRKSIILLLLLNAAARLIPLAFIGEVNSRAILLVLWTLPFAWIGLLLGRLLQGRMSEKSIRWLSMTLIAFTVLSGLWREASRGG